MNTTVIENPGAVYLTGTSEVRTLWIAYVLYALIVTAPLGLIITLYKLHDYRRRTIGRELERIQKHHLWLMRTLLVSAFLVPVAIGTSYYLWGFIVAIIGAGWWLYRMARGILALARHQAVPVSV